MSADEKPVCWCGQPATWWVNAKQTVWSGFVDTHEGFIGMCDKHRYELHKEEA